MREEEEEGGERREEGNRGPIDERKRKREKEKEKEKERERGKGNVCVCVCVSQSGVVRGVGRRDDFRLGKWSDRDDFHERDGKGGIIPIFIS